MQIIGYLEIDVEAYTDWYMNNGFYVGVNHAVSIVSNKMNEDYNKYYDFKKSAVEAMKFYTCDQYSGKVEEDSETYRIRKLRWEKKRSYYIDDLKNNVISYLNMFDQKFGVVYKDDICIFAKVGKNMYYFPVSAYGIKISEFKDYSGIDTSSENDSIPITGSIVPSGSCLKDVNEEYQSLKQQQDSYESKIKDIENGKCEELEELQTQLEKLQAILDKKKSDLINRVNKLKDELEEKKSELNKQILMIETQIYAIRCYTGEVINFTKLRHGKSCKVDDPIVLHQKLRYLDDEMGRLCALYDFDFSDVKYFEEFISESNEAFDIFCPSDKCISLVKISKTGKVVGMSSVYHNVLEMYEVYHGSAIGILIRDGENLYMGWTDDDKISVPDNLFYVPKTVTDEYDIDPKEESSTRGEILSRYFIFNIIQGCIASDMGHRIINLPDGINITQPNPYVIFSSADGWIDSNKYEPFREILDMCNSNTKVGDHIITCLYLYASSYDSYSNERGRGYKNITRGAHLSNNSVEVINLIDNDKSSAKYDTGIVDKVNTRCRTYNTATGEYDYIDTVNEELRVYHYHFDNNSTLKTCQDNIKKRCEEDGIEFDPSKLDIRLCTNYYVSVLKDDSEYVFDEYGRYKDRERESRVNFYVDEQEFINIEVMNSNWLEYFITSKKVEGTCIGSKYVNYSYLIMYLNTAIKHTRKREIGEKAMLIDAGFSDFDKIDWLDRLSRYKINTGRHVLKPRWAKQLAQQLNDEISTLNKNN